MGSVCEGVCVCSVAVLERAAKAESMLSCARRTRGIDSIATVVASWALVSEPGEMKLAFLFENLDRSFLDFRISCRCFAQSAGPVSQTCLLGKIVQRSGSSEVTFESRFGSWLHFGATLDTFLFMESELGHQ